MATLEDGAQAVLLGLAANQSMARGGQPVKVQALLKQRRACRKGKT